MVNIETDTNEIGTDDMWFELLKYHRYQKEKDKARNKVNRGHKLFIAQGKVTAGHAL